MGLYYNPTIVTDGLVLALDAANQKSYPGSGTTWTDMSGNNNTGTLTNGPTFSSANQGNIVFDGTNDYVVINNSSTFNNNAGTIDFWIYINSLANADWFVYGIGSGSFGQLYIRVYSSSLTFAFIGIGKQLTYSFTGSNLTNNFPTSTWRHICATYDNAAGSGTIYVNGYSVATMTSGSNAFSSWTSANMYIGGYSWDGYSSNRFASLKMYNTALTSSQVLQNFNASRGRFNL